MAVTWINKPSSNPNIGECYLDSSTGIIKMFDGLHWCDVSAGQGLEPAFIPPTNEQLKKYPALKQAWEEFLVIKKLLGV